MRFVDPITGLRRFLYLVTPNETMASTPDEVTNFVEEAIPYFILLILLEYFVSCIIQRRHVANQHVKPARINDGIASLSAGIISQLPILLFGRTIELSGYIWIYNHFAIIHLPWDSVCTWLLCFIGIEFCYYWLHRMGHEVSILWAFHQVHHSSEAYNLTTALRQSVTQGAISWLFYIPLALCIPPSIFMIHIQFNLLYQFWIHTELIGTLGPLEWLLNTPSHHRVHHGRNPYCINKNYGAVFIVFDRLFGTFADEKSPKEEPIGYGLVYLIETFHPIQIQMCHFQYLFKEIYKATNFVDQLKLLFYSPGWQKGKARLTDPKDIPPVKSTQVKFNPQQTCFAQIYCVAHFIFIFIFYATIVTMKNSLAFASHFVATTFVLFSLTNFGVILNDGFHATVIGMELIRMACAVAMAWFAIGW